MEEPEEQNVNQEEQPFDKTQDKPFDTAQGEQSVEPVGDATPTPSSNRKLIVGIVAVVVLVIGGMAGVYYFSAEKQGYYTYGQSCSYDSECVCVGIQGTADICGKPDQYPACNDGICGWGSDGELAGNKYEIIDTSDWKTYRNEEFGFELKYPENDERFSCQAGDPRVGAPSNTQFRCSVNLKNDNAPYVLIIPFKEKLIGEEKVIDLNIQSSFLRVKSSDAFNSISTKSKEYDYEIISTEPLLDFKRLVLSREKDSGSIPFKSYEQIWYIQDGGTLLFIQFSFIQAPLDKFEEYKSQLKYFEEMISTIKFFNP